MKNYIFVPTKHPDIFRVEDRWGMCERYYRKSSDQYFNSIDEILAEGYKDFDARDESLEEEVNEIGRTIEEILSTNATFFHLTAGDFPPAQWDSLVGFANFWEGHKPILLASSAMLFNAMFKYAGKASAIIIITKICGSDESCPCKDLVGKVGLFNWQLDEPHPTDIAKLCSLSVTDNLGEYLPAMDNLGYTAILALAGSQTEVRAYRFSSFNPEEMTDAWPRFLGALRIFEFIASPFDASKDIAEIPDEVNIKLSHFNFAKDQKEAKKFAKKKEHVAKVRQIEIDPSKVKVGVWIIAATGENAEIVELEDDGTVHYKTISGQVAASHYTVIRHIYDAKPDFDEETVDTSNLPSGTLKTPKRGKKQLSR